MLAPGTLFAGQFRVLRPLAEGGTGALYIVEQQGTKQWRALKVLLPALAQDPDLCERFQREAQLGGSIPSEHVVQVIAAGIDDASATPWLVMEFLDGKTLSEYVADHGPFLPAQALVLVRQLKHAVGAAHRLRIVHRDLKPENLFIAHSRSADTPFTLKVLDFGFAKLLAETGVMSAATGAMGTPFWMAPEQLDPNGMIGPQTDVWALGLLAFFFLSGKLYWKSGQSFNAAFSSMLAELLGQEFDPPSQRIVQLGGSSLVFPPGFDAWFARCVCRDALARFRDADEALTALEVLLTPPPNSFVAMAPNPGPTATETTPAPSSSRSMVLWIVALIACLFAGGGYVRSYAMRERPTATQAPPPPERSVLVVPPPAKEDAAVIPRPPTPFVAAPVRGVARRVRSTEAVPIVSAPTAASSSCAGRWSGRYIHPQYGGVSVALDVTGQDGNCGQSRESWARNAERCTYQLLRCGGSSGELTASLDLVRGSSEGCDRGGLLRLACNRAQGTYGTNMSAYGVRIPVQRGGR